jgi:hypothetical protein
MPPRIDDPSIPDDAVLWRRILPSWVHKSPEGERPQSFAFIDTLSGEVSFQIAAETTKQDVLQDYPDHRIVAIKAAFLRSLGYVLVRDPEGGGAAHVLMCPATPMKRKALEKDAKRIALAAEWVP